MTTIAFDGRYLAADGRSTFGNMINGKRAQKIFGPFPVHYCGESHQAALAIAGSYESGHRLRDYLVNACEISEEQADRPQFDDDAGFEAVLYVQNVGTFTIERNLVPLPAEVPITLGSGSQFALGALAAGKTPLEAVKVAAELDCFTGGEFRVFDVESMAFLE